MGPPIIQILSVVHVCRKLLIFCFLLLGCYWHGHDCHLNQGKGFNTTRDKPLKELLEETEKNSAYIRQQGFNLVECWECEWRDMKKTNKELQRFNLVECWECEWRDMKKTNKELQRFISTRLRRPLDKVKTLTLQTILDAVRNEKIFGCIECDIHVPEHLRDKFSEMCPVFKNTEISRDDIGEFMKAYAEENDIMVRPRRSLVGSMIGEKILLATPLLKWYLEHGLEVTRVYQVIEYTPKPCFKPFGDAVSNARRAGDADPSKAIIADTMKLSLTNSPFFRELNPIDDDTYEVQSSKKKIKLDLPLQVGFFVYRYTKLRMLQFYYNFLNKYLDRSDLEYCEMDTDSAYIAISGECVEGLIKPQMMCEFENDKCNWFPRTDTVEHAKYDKRTPGLFKVEWEGDGIISLCSIRHTIVLGIGKTNLVAKGLTKRIT